MADYDNVSDELDALINGNYESDESDVDASDAEDNNEDTDHTEADDTETETNDTAAELGDDTDAGTEDDGEENTPVDNDGVEESNDDEDGVEGDEADDASDADEGSDKDDSKDAEDSTDTDENSDGEDSKTTDTVDYQKQYEELLVKSKDATDFYEQVAGVKFKANGKEFEGFKDPKKIIQAQQMAYNYSEKMAGFKAYRPYMGPLKDRGMLDDTSKFDLAMSLIDGDREAL